MSRWRIQIENQGELVISTNGKFEIKDISDVPENISIDQKRFVSQHMKHLCRYLQRYGSLNIKLNKNA